MGLPLFVAPVERNPPQTTSTKDRIVASSRSGIRRQPPADDRSSANRRSAARVLGQSHPSLPPAFEPYPQWVDSDLSADQRRIREVHLSTIRALARGRRARDRDVPVGDNGQPSFSGILSDIAPNPAHRDDEQRQIDDLGWLSAEHRSRDSRARRARVITPVGSRLIGPSRRARTINSPPPPPPPPPPGNLAQGQLHVTSSLVGEEDQPAAPSSNRALRLVRSRSDMPRQSSGRRSQLPRLARGIDGLGDRDRSVSPENWDTLLTTLTPDPQPPSAESSFAPTAVTHTTGPFAMARSTSEVTEDANMDHACESVSEMSDSEPITEEQYQAAVGFARYVSREERRMRELRHGGPEFYIPSERVPDYNLDGFAEDTFAHESGSFGRHEDVARRIARLRTQADAWVGHLWREPSEEETETDHSWHHREDSLGRGHIVQAGDDDWVGMQRIVRSLAAREDIPDEWWAEAGLSRTLRQEETN